jgi:hypothetical protein
VVQLLHEVWAHPDGRSIGLSLAAARADELRAKVDPDHRLVHSILASSWLEAMTLYHAWQGWEPYRPMPDFEYEPYTEEQRQQQVAEGKLAP